MAEPVWFWQRIITPHMAGLASAMAEAGHDVTYVAQQEMSADRASQGWQVPALGGARLLMAPTRDTVKAAASAAPAGAVHICQGLRGNGLVGAAQERLAQRGARQWIILETIDDPGLAGKAKRMLYRILINRRQKHIEGMLAIGHDTPRWMTARGMAPERIYPFAYFLADQPEPEAGADVSADEFRFMFVGQFIERKRVGLLIEALSLIAERSFSLTLVGSGPLEAALRAEAARLLPGRAQWLGRQPIDRIPALMASADCLVLPSRYDGWGAVVSEALMAGTPVICSDTCGSAAVVQASGAGGVFTADDLGSLAAELARTLATGRQTAARRAALAGWARKLGATQGAAYLSAILAHAGGRGPRPREPWSAGTSA